MTISRSFAWRCLSLLTLLSLFVGLTSYPVSAVSPQVPTSGRDSPFGLNTHLATRFPYIDGLDMPLDLVAQLGVKWAREDFAWPRIEPRQGRWDWDFTDMMVEKYRTHDVSILGRLGYSVGWATADASDRSDGQSFAFPDIDAWRRYVTATVSRYHKTVKYWEVWNEPDNPRYWVGQPDPAAYAQLLQVARDAIKAVDPEAMILNGGVSPFEPSFLEGLARVGAWNAFDILSIHPYTDPYSPEQGQIGPSGVGGIRALMSRYGHKPIWATEFGWESAPSKRDPQGLTDEDRQASYLVRSYLQLLAEPGLNKAFWYTLHDDQDSPFGLMRFGSGYTDYSSRKPSFDAYTTMAHELAGAHFASTLDLSTSRLVVDGWEGSANWVQAGPANGALVSSSERAYSGNRSGRYDYRFPTADNDYVAFRPAVPLDMGEPSSVGLWVYGDNSGHLLQLQLEDQSGELLQFPLGKIGGTEWTWLQAPVTGTASPGNRLGGGDNNGRLDGRVRLRALVIDDLPNEYIGSGTIWVDDLTAFGGPETYGYRWQRGGETIDVVYAPAGTNVRLLTNSASAIVVDRDGRRSDVAATDGAIQIWADGRPRYVHHTPAAKAPPIPSPNPSPASFIPAAPDPAFAAVWARTDAAVAQHQTARSWTWGPASFATGIEGYDEAPDGHRLVQYWDKSRMEITNPGMDRSMLWFVTNGLLAKELISGKLQTGNGSFVDREPAQVPVAGDPNDENSPSYASFGGLASLDGDKRVAARVGSIVTARIDRLGNVTEDMDMSNYGVRIGAYDEHLGHNMATVFEDYSKNLPLDWVFVLGYPISEPYWATVAVGGVPKHVLIQVFERRVLTYTPSNTAAFRVEMGNVGQHYFRWRYGLSPWEQ